MKTGYSTEAQRTIHALQHIGELLHRYIIVHDDIFKFSIRRILPIPGLFQAIDFPSHVATLDEIGDELSDTISDVATSAYADHMIPMLLVGYGNALLTTVNHLRSICDRLGRKAEREDYPNEDYNRDVAEYQALVREYQRHGAKLNAALGR